MKVKYHKNKLGTAYLKIKIGGAFRTVKTVAYKLQSGLFESIDDRMRTVIGYQLLNNYYELQLIASASNKSHDT